MHTIPTKVKGTFSLIVEEKHLANHLKDPSLPAVLATPTMVLVMESAALNAIREYLEPGESAVGTAIDIRHLASTPVGQLVTAEAEVMSVVGRRVSFAVSAWDEVEDIGMGIHERVIVDLGHVEERLMAKNNRRRQGHLRP